jgi:hypothetical protein
MTRKRRRQGRGALAALAISLLTLAVAPTLAAAFHGHRVFVPQGGTTLEHQYRGRVVYISGDSTFLIQGVKWLSYNGAVARGEGVSNTTGCVPNCASSPREYRRIDFSLSRPRKSCGAFFYTRFRATWPQRKPPGLPEPYKSSTLPATACP